MLFQKHDTWKHKIWIQGNMHLPFRQKHIHSRRVHVNMCNRSTNSKSSTTWRPFYCWWSIRRNTWRSATISYPSCYLYLQSNSAWGHTRAFVFSASHTYQNFNSPGNSTTIWAPWSKEGGFYKKKENLRYTLTHLLKKRTEKSTAQERGRNQPLKDWWSFKRKIWSQNQTYQVKVK